MASVKSDGSRHAKIIEALGRLSPVDLAGVRMKLADPDEGEGWDEETVATAELEYRRFLALVYAYPDRTIVPDKVADIFWHCHILDTRAYADDTNMVFGSFLHHFPYLGMNGKEDSEKLAACFDETVNLYESHFGKKSTLRTDGSRCSTASCSRCSRSNQYQRSLVR